MLNAENKYLKMSNEIQGYVQLKHKEDAPLEVGAKTLELPQKISDLLLFKCVKCGLYIRHCQCSIKPKPSWHANIYQKIKKTIQVLQTYFGSHEATILEPESKILIEVPKQTTINVPCPEDFYSTETLEQLQEGYRIKASHFLENFYFYDEKCAELDKKIVDQEFKKYREAIN